MKYTPLSTLMGNSLRSARSFSSCIQQLQYLWLQRVLSRLERQIPSASGWHTWGLMRSDVQMCTAEAIMKRMRKFIEQEAGNPNPAAQKVLFCPKKCMAYTGQAMSSDTCQQCLQPKDNSSYFFKFSLCEQIKKWFNDPDLAKSIRDELSRSTQLASDGDVTTLGSGWIQQLRSKKVSGKHSTKGELASDVHYFADTNDSIDLTFTLTLDGISPYGSKSADWWVLILVNNSFPPQARHNAENIFIPMVFPKAPKKDLDGTRNDNSFFQPIVDEFAELTVYGVKVMDRYLDKEVTVRAHLTQVSGDIPAISFAMGMLGHNSTHPCRACSIEKTGPGKLRGLRFPGPEVASRTEEDVSRNMMDRALGTRTGIREYSVFMDLPTICFPWSFIPDYMHLVHVNCSKTLFSILKDDRCNLRGPASLSMLDSVTRKLNRLPSDKGGGDYPTEFFSKGRESNTKSIVWKMMIEHLGLYVRAAGHLDEIARAVFELLYILRELSRRKLCNADLDCFELRISKNIEYLDTRQLPGKYFTVPMHMLLHVIEYIRRNGLPRDFGAIQWRGAVRRLRNLSRAVPNHLLLPITVCFSQTRLI